ncbi:hypothetical protein FG05_35433 [Fusarium graminearum]|nr:hypothetical protein FG05_35433 [Fusarium graminearum]
MITEVATLGAIRGYRVAYLISYNKASLAKAVNYFSLSKENINFN